MQVETTCFLFGHQAYVEKPAKTYYAFNRFCYVKKGGTTYIDDDDQVQIREGYFYLFPVRSYSLGIRPEGGYDHVWGHILIKGFQFNKVIEINPQEYDVLPALLNYMEKIILEDSEPPIEEYEDRLWQIVTSDNQYFSLLKHIICTIVEMISLQMQQHNSSDDLQVIIDYITFNLDKDLSNENLAKIVMYHKNYFIQKFTEKYAMSPQKFVLKTRISEANMMLMNDVKIQDIAFRLGYENAKSFSRAFKREVGISPYEYKSTHYYGIKC